MFKTKLCNEGKFTQVKKLHGILTFRKISQQYLERLLMLNLSIFKLFIYLRVKFVSFYFRARGFFPVYNYVSSPSNAVSWGQYVKYGRMMKDCFSIQQSIWYYSVFLTKSSTLQEIAHFFLHRIPGIIIDKIVVWNGQKPRYTYL